MSLDSQLQSREAGETSLTPMRGRVRLMTLVLLRWLAVGGQFIAIFTVYYGFGYPLPLVPCLVVIAIPAALNVFVSLRYPSTKRLSGPETAAYLAFDIVQLSLLLALTGGLENPFSVLIVAPVVISATTLPVRSTIGLVALALFAATVLAFTHWPLPWDPEQPFKVPVTYVWGMWFGLVLGIGFTTIYAWRIATEAKRMSDALSATQAILAREHRLSAVGSLAAAAAHELGTPLATIALVAKELRRALPADGPHADDVALLGSQVERCRDILRRLSIRPEEDDRHTSLTPLRAVLDEAAEPQAGFGIAIDIDMPTDQGPEPVVRRSPELLHSVGNVIENAVDFARSRVGIEARWSDKEISLAISDDGPGFDHDVLDRLGEPYVTTRPNDTNLRQGIGDDAPEGMGLGFFIAKTFIERIGGRIAFGNRGGAGGAIVELHWPREKALPKADG